uniref:Uncharacterized protein n=1 Tax=Echinococcus canadensis TaxID=519352 RepID=A0A915ETJ8_9CEST
SVELFPYSEAKTVTGLLLAQQSAHFGIDMKLVALLRTWRLKTMSGLPLYGPSPTGLSNLLKFCCIYSAIPLTEYIHLPCYSLHFLP